MRFSAVYFLAKCKKYMKCSNEKGTELRDKEVQILVENGN